MPKQEYWCLCQRRCKLNSRRHIPPGIKFRRYVKRITGKDCLETDVLCNSCTARVYREVYQPKTRFSFLDQSHPVMLNICLNNLLPQYSTVQSLFLYKSLLLLEHTSTVLSADGMEVDDFDSYKFLRQHQRILLSKLEFLSTQIIDVAVIIWKLASSTDMHLDW